MLNQRQTELFKLIVEDYIKTAKPVSSTSICQNLNCSSATIRNEMSFLEDNDLLEKTHISSGRIPSEIGYRYYVDNIMKPKELTGEDMLSLQTLFNNKYLVIDDYISKSLELVSELTSLTAVQLGKSSKENCINKIEVIVLNQNTLVAILITDKGHVEHRNIYIENTPLEDIKITVDLINKMVFGISLEEVSKFLEIEVKPIISQYVKQHEMLYNAFYNAFTDFHNETSIIMKGRNNILMHPEFDNTDKIRDIITKFEDKTKLDKIGSKNCGINICIGSETEFDDDVTIIKMNYNTNKEEGTIAIVGPKRMEYNRVIPILEYLKKNIEEEK